MFSSANKLFSEKNKCFSNRENRDGNSVATNNPLQGRVQSSHKYLRWAIVINGFYPQIIIANLYILDASRKPEHVMTLHSST